MGMIGCPETSVQNYHSTLHSISEDHRSDMMIWRCSFSLVPHGLVPSYVVWCGPVQDFIREFKTTSHI